MITTIKANNDLNVLYYLLRYLIVLYETYLIAGGKGTYLKGSIRTYCQMYYGHIPHCPIRTYLILLWRMYLNILCAHRSLYYTHILHCPIRTYLIVLYTYLIVLYAHTWLKYTDTSLYYTHIAHCPIRTSLIVLLLHIHHWSYTHVPHCTIRTYLIVLIRT